MSYELRVLFSVFTYLQIVLQELLDHIVHHFVNRFDVMVPHALVCCLFASVFVCFGIQLVGFLTRLANSSFALCAVFHYIVVAQFVICPPPSILSVFLLLMRPASKNAFRIFNKKVLLSCSDFFFGQLHVLL